MTVSDSSIATHVCPKCNEEKPLTREFWFTKQRTDKSIEWTKYSCRICLNIARREHERLRAREKRSTEEGRIASNAARRKWCAANPEKRQAERQRAAEKKGKGYMPGVPAYIAASFALRGRPPNPHREELKKEKKAEIDAVKAFKEWFARKTDEQVKHWYDVIGKPWLNPRLTDAEQYRTKYQHDSEFAINERIRRQLNKEKNKDGIADIIRCALNNGGKSNSVEKQLGYSISELRTHLEKQFTKGMTWDKFKNGQIHIDHIHPKKSFDMSNADEWKTCWSLPNLKPMWASDNISKGAKILTLL